jgi:hypothetical protein
MSRYLSQLAVSATAIALCLPVDGPAQAGGDWIDLMPGPALEGWKRVPIAPDVKLADKNPWSVDAAGKMLLCDGVGGIKEMLLYDKDFGDGTFHLEWRFRKVEGKKDYNGGVYVRTSPDGKVWHQAQVAHLEKPPLLGDLFGDTLVDGKTQKFLAQGKGDTLAQPPGAWNTYDIVCAGPEISVRVNGMPATLWKECKVPRGRVGLQAEFFFVEFKNLKFKPAAP